MFASINQHYTHTFCIQYIEKPDSLNRSTKPKLKNRELNASIKI